MLRKLLIAVLAIPTIASADPNIIVIVADDLSTEGISAYGSGLGGAASTPSIDAIATVGAKFTNAFHVTSVCTPARVMLWTGQYPWKTQVWNNGDTLVDTIPTMMDSLVSDGYDTAIIGKWQTPPMSPDSSIAANLGWEHREVCQGSECGGYTSATFVVNGTAEVAPDTNYITTTITDRAIAYMEARDADPFLLVLTHKAPHHPWTAATEDNGDLDATVLTEPASINDTHVGRAPQIALRSSTLLNLFTTWTTGAFATCPEGPSGYCKDTPPGSVDTDAERISWIYQEYGHDYLEVIKSLDREVGRILAYLISEGIDDETVVIFTSDNGLFMGEHSWDSKLHYLNGSSAMVLLMSGPGISAGQTRAEMVSNLDLAPTILALAGIAKPAVMDGRSLTELTDGTPATDWRTSTYVASFPGVGATSTANISHYALITSDYKLAHFFYQGSGTPHAWELIDRAGDPDERTNQYDNPAYGTIRNSLRDQLKTLQQSLGIYSQHNGWLSYTPP